MPTVTLTIEQLDELLTRFRNKIFKAESLKDQAAQKLSDIGTTTVAWRKMRIQEEADKLRLEAFVLEVQGNAEIALINTLFPEQLKHIVFPIQ